jgi:hypothetical protein
MKDPGKARGAALSLVAMKCEHLMSSNKAMRIRINIRVKALQEDSRAERAVCYLHYSRAQRAVCDVHYHTAVILMWRSLQHTISIKPAESARIGRYRT